MANLRFKTFKEFATETPGHKNHVYWRSHVARFYGMLLDDVTEEPALVDFIKNTTNEKYKQFLCKEVTEEYLQAYKEQHEYLKKVLSTVKIDYITNDHSYVIIRDVNYDFEFSIMVNPTGNCQLACINHFDEILRNRNSKFISTLLTYLVYNYTKKPLFLVDVKRSYSKNLTNLADYIIQRSDYVSSNGSLMTIAILNMEKI